jgi:hypothetical protein
MGEAGKKKVDTLSGGGSIWIDALEDTFAQSVKRFINEK